MKYVSAIPKFKAGLAVKLLLSAVILSQLVACGGGGSTKVATTSSDARIPDAYQATTLADTTTAAGGADEPQPQQTGQLKLNWSAPTTRTDGEPLSLAEIDGYRVYYGTDKGDYVKGADVKDGSAQAATVTGVPVGEYYVVMTTYDVNGNESGYSQAIKKNVS